MYAACIELKHRSVSIKMYTAIVRMDCLVVWLCVRFTVELTLTFVFCIRIDTIYSSTAADMMFEAGMRRDVWHTPRQVASHPSYSAEMERFTEICGGAASVEPMWNLHDSSAATVYFFGPNRTKCSIHLYSPPSSNLTRIEATLGRSSPPFIWVRSREAKFLNDAQLQMHDRAPNISSSMFGVHYICIWHRVYKSSTTSQHQYYFVCVFSSSGVRRQF